jgi:orotate phosphoribosyltransferase
VSLPFQTAAVVSYDNAGIHGEFTCDSLATGTRVYDKQALMALVKERALRFGEFTLASGKKASYYLDGKQVTLDSDGARLVAEGILDLLGEPLPTAVGGMAIGADPITAAVITMAAVRGQSLKGVLIRKESKGHGTNRFIEGPVKPGDDLAIVEDVVTTGGSSLEAIERAEAFGLKIKCVLAIVDRMEGGAQAFAARGYRFASLLTIRDFGIEPPN